MQPGKSQKNFHFLLVCLIIFTALITLTNSFSIMCMGYGTQGYGQQESVRVIHGITVTGNSIVNDRAILNKLPFKVGDTFKKETSGKIIHLIYNLGYFKNIRLIEEERIDGTSNIHIVVEEKKLLNRFEFEGNDNYSTNKLSEKLEISKIKTIDEKELISIENKIKRAYLDKGYNNATAQGELKVGADKSVIVYFKIDEGAKSRVKIVSFKGNKNISSRTLRKKIFTREDWILGFFDKAGTYHPDALMQDKYIIENIYKSNGYLGARVIDTEVEKKEDGAVNITFVIDEGELYTISEVNAPGNDILSEAQILAHIPIWPKQLYSAERIKKSMEILRLVWGEYGYIYADIVPSVRPDEKTKTVKITFKSSIGEKVKIRRINIIGNDKTRDEIIRRELLFDEGEKITTRLMDASKKRLELLGYFDNRDGINWNITKLDEGNIDLDLILKEVKTGHIQVRGGLGMQQDASSPTKGFSVGLDAGSRNFLGMGVNVGFNGSYSQQDKMISTSASSNWFYGRPISTALNLFKRNITYEDFRLTIDRPVEKTWGGSIHSGFRVEWLDYLHVGVGVGYEDICFTTSTAAKILHADPALQKVVQARISRTLESGDLLWTECIFSQDKRNHPIFPSEGYRWHFDAKFGSSNNNCGDFGFFKFGLDAHWYTTIIQELNVVLHLHGFAGIVEPLSGNVVPYKELFHIGGPATMRGFTYGAVGPALAGSSIGATKAFFTNIELHFPITADGNMRGVVFYDGGSSWDTPQACDLPSSLLVNNSFDYRHSIGFGIRMQSPQPISIDIGFKLDRKRKRGERLREVHFSALQAI